MTPRLALVAAGAAALIACGGGEGGALRDGEDAVPVTVLDTLAAADDGADGVSDSAAPLGEVALTAAVALPGRRVAVRVDAADRRSGRVAIGATTVLLHHGRGVLTTTPEAAPELHLAVAPFGDGDRALDGEVVVAAGETLRWEPGTRVLVGPDARLIVRGTLIAAGTEAAPILLTPGAASGAPWAAIEVQAGGRAELSHTWLVGGGADHDRFGGHSGSDPVVAAVDGVVEMTGGGVVDGVGKAFYTEGATVTLDDVTIARCDTGGEHVGSRVTMRGGWVVEIPDADGQADDDDNDGIYLRLGSHRLEGVTFAMGEDDAIDQNGADVEIRGVVIDGFRHEGIAASNGGVVTVSDTVIRRAQQGIEVGYGGPAVHVAGVTITGCGVGLRWGDEYAWEALGTLVVERSVVLGNGVGVEAEDPQQGAAPEGAVTITCSAVGTPRWDAVGGNIADAPVVVDGCPPVLSACGGPIGAARCE